MAQSIKHIQFIPKESDGLNTSDSKEFFVKSITEYSYDIAFYQNSAEDNRVDKTDYLTPIINLNGVFREGSSITNIVVEIELNSVPNFNYAFIPAFNRYYFITDIEFITNKLYTIYMSVDVLMSYKDGIYNLNAFIDRNEFDYNNKIIDSKRIVEQGFDVSEIVVTNGLLKFLDSYAYSDASYILTGYDIYLNYVDEQPPRDYSVTPSGKWLTDSPTQRSLDIDFQRSIILGDTGVSALVNKLTSLFATNGFFQNPDNFLSSLIFYPIHLTDKNAVGQGWLVIGNETPDISDPNRVYSRGYLDDYYNTYFDCGYVTIPKYYNNFADYNGYTKIRIYLPYYGFVDIDPNECMGETILFRLMIDFKTGQAMYVICLFDDTTNSVGRVLSNVTFQLGVDIPLGKTNTAEIKRNAVLGAIKTIGNFAIGNYFGALSNTTSIRNVTTTETTEPRNVNTTYTSRNPATNRQRTMSTRNTQVSGSTKTATTRSIQTSHSNAYKGRVASDVFNSAVSTLSSLSLNTAIDKPNNAPLLSYLSTNIRVLIYRPIIQDIDNNYRHIFGVPLGEVRNLKDLNGYTEIANIHIEDNHFLTATENEKNQIQDTLLSGIIL